MIKLVKRRIKRIKVVKRKRLKEERLKESIPRKNKKGNLFKRMRKNE